MNLACQEVELVHCRCDADVDKNGTPTLQDVFALTDCINGLVPKTMCAYGDVNCDGNIDSCDIAIVNCQAFAPDPTCCETVTCGACCQSGSCMSSEESLCDPGVYLGDGTTCEAEGVAECGYTASTS